MDLIENEYVKHESNKIEKTIESNRINKTIESNEIKKQLSLIKSKFVSQIGSKTVTRETTNANYGAHSGVPNAEMGGLVTQRCDCGDQNGGGDVQGHRRSRSRRRRRSVSVKWGAITDVA